MSSSNRVSWAACFFRKPEWKELPDGEIVWKHRWYHQVGFRLFVASFFVSAVSLVAARWRGMPPREWSFTLGLICLAAVSAAWLVADQVHRAGVSQRVLLALIFVWTIQNMRLVQLSCARVSPKNENRT